MEPDNADQPIDERPSADRLLAMDWTDVTGLGEDYRKFISHGGGRVLVTKTRIVDELSDDLERSTHHAG